MTYLANASGASCHFSSAHLSCRCMRQFHASSYSPCADNAMLHVCTVCLSALSPRAFSDATGACSFPMQVQPICAWLLMPPRSTLNPQPMWDRTQCINASVCCPLGGQFWGIVHTSQVVPNGSSPHCLKLGSLVMQSYFGFSFFFFLNSPGSFTHASCKHLSRNYLYPRPCLRLCFRWNLN